MTTVYTMEGARKFFLENHRDEVICHRSDGWERVAGCYSEAVAFFEDIKEEEEE